MKGFAALFILAKVIFFSIEGVRGATLEKPSQSWPRRPRWEPLKLAEKITQTVSKQDQKTVTAISSIASNRRACGVFVWDALSAAKYHLCHYLMRDKIYEGRGGRRFVRIEPGSILKLLYPPSAHSPDRCMFCGGTFRDHLILWWSKRHLYSPFDLYLDRTLKNGVLAVNSSSPKEKLKGKAKTLNAARPVGITQVEEEKVYAFHRQYVLDVTQHENQGSKSTESDRDYRKFIKARAGDLEKRSFAGFSYYVPRDPSPTPKILDFFIREIVLDEIDLLLEIQKQENFLLRRKKLY